MKTLFEEGDPASILAVLDLAPAMVRDFGGRILHWTSGAEDLYGWTSHEAVGRLSHELLETEFPIPLEEIEASLMSEGVWHGALRHRARNGQMVRVASHWALQRDASGAPGAVAEVNTNIGAHERAEAARNRLAAIVESSSDAVLGKTLDGRVTDWNPGAEALFGYSASEMVGQSVTKLYPPDRIDDEQAILDRVRRGERIATFQTVRRRKNGTDLPVAVTVSPILGAGGVIVGASTIMRDLTAWVERDRRLGELQADLAHAGRVGELGQLVTALVHEVNQPLSAIRNYNSGLQRVIESGAYDLAPRAVKGIGDEVKRADEIIRRLREFARKGVPAVQGENLADIVKEAIELASINPAAKGVVFRTQLVDMSSRVLVDRIQVQQVMFNLIRNALEAMEGRQQRILTVESAAKGDQMIEVSVADTGRGIPDQLLGELFKPFVTTKATGMGVGLSVCRMIVEGHGGELTAETRADVGTVFRMTLQREPSERIGDQQTSRR